MICHSVLAAKSVERESKRDFMPLPGDPESINADKDRLRLGGRSDESSRMLSPSFRHSDGSQSLSMPVNSICHSELVSESLNKEIDSGSEAGMTNLSHVYQPCHPELDSGSIKLDSGSINAYRNNLRSIGRSDQLSRKAAFTMAEVLITLGIIGIVAAMTLPSMINNIRNKHLHTALKKAYSRHSEALALVKDEMGIDNLQAEFATYDNANKVYPRAQEFMDAYYKRLKIVGKCKYPKGVRNYNNTNDAYVDKGASQPNNMLADGSCAAVIINGANVNISVDINGSGAKPNRLGHDIFTFNTNKQGILVPTKMSKLYTEDELKELEDRPATMEQAGNPCSIKSKQKGNGIGCTWYALYDVNPDNEKAGYWKNLPK